jgi:hypothetical protein
MQLWKKFNSIKLGILPAAVVALALSLAACARTPPAFVVHSAAIDSGTLTAHLEWRPDARVLEALENGIALEFAVVVQAQAPATFGWRQTVASQTRHLQLRHFPLSRQYQLRDLDLGQARSYAARALALAALEDLRLPLPNWNAAKAERYSVQIMLDRDALPGALRLPALFLPAWRLCKGELTWPARAG